MCARTAPTDPASRGVLCLDDDDDMQTGEGREGRIVGLLRHEVVSALKGNRKRAMQKRTTKPMIRLAELKPASTPDDACSCRNACSLALVLRSLSGLARVPP
jgi:hypothetical protein